MISRVLRFLCVLSLVFAPIAAAAGAPGSRLALVVGNAAYKAGTLVTPANDAALIADTLRMQGFDVTGSRDLDAKRLRQAFEQFHNKVAASGPGSVVVIYFAGLGLQLDGDNYLIPVDAVPTQTSDIRRDAVQLSGVTRSLAELAPKAAFVILDAARKNPFSIADGPLANGLTWVEPESNSLVALSAAPGTVASSDDSAFGPYAVAIAEMFRQDGLSSGDLFTRVRLRVNEATNGGQVPWHNAKLENSFVFAERASDASQRTDRPELTRPFRTRPMRTLSAGDAYFTALMRDTFDGYSEFLAEYWNDPMTSRVRALLAARREALTWHRSTQTSTVNAYWTYLERYPLGPHVADAQRWLTDAGALVVPPADFARMECDVPAPLPDERQYLERKALSFGDSDLAFGTLQPVPNYFLSASTFEPGRLAVPGRSIGDHELPALAPASSVKPGLPVAAAPPLATQAKQPSAVQAKAGDAVNSSSPVPPSARPVAQSPIAGGTVTPAAPTVAAVPWIAGGPSDQSALPSGDVQGLTPFLSLPSAPNRNTASDTGEQLPSADTGARRQALDPSNRGRPEEGIPLPMPRPSAREPRALRQAVRTANPGALRAGAVATNGRSAAAASGPEEETSQPALRPSLDALPTRVPLGPIHGDGGPFVTGTFPGARRIATTRKPAEQPAKKPAADALLKKPAAIRPTDQAGQ